MEFFSSRYSCLDCTECRYRQRNGFHFLYQTTLNNHAVRRKTTAPIPSFIRSTTIVISVPSNKNETVLDERMIAPISLNFWSILATITSSVLTSPLNQREVGLLLLNCQHCVRNDPPCLPVALKLSSETQGQLRGCLIQKASPRKLHLGLFVFVLSLFLPLVSRLLFSARFRFLLRFHNDHTSCVSTHNIYPLCL